MSEEIKNFIDLFLTTAAGIIIYFYLNTRFSRLDKDLKEIDKDIENHKLHIAEKYITKEDHEKDLNSLKEYMKSGFEGIEKAISSIHRRFDRLEDNIKKELDNKQDKEK